MHLVEISLLNIGEKLSSFPFVEGRLDGNESPWFYCDLKQKEKQIKLKCSTENWKENKKKNPSRHNFPSAQMCIFYFINTSASLSLKHRVIYLVVQLIAKQHQPNNTRRFQAHVSQEI